MNILKSFFFAVLAVACLVGLMRTRAGFAVDLAFCEAFAMLALVAVRFAEEHGRRGK